MSENNSKYKTQFHKGLCHAFDMVAEAIEKLLLEEEKKHIMEAHVDGFQDAYGVMEKRTSEEYYKEKYEQV